MAEQIIPIISEMKTQFKEWRELLIIKVSAKQYSTFNSSFYSLVSCMDYNNPRYVAELGND